MRFLLAVVVGAMVPGATTALVATAVGTAALVAVSEAAFIGLKIVGACVLVFLRVQAWRAARKDTVDELPQAAVSRGRRPGRARFLLAGAAGGWSTDPP